MDEDEGKTPIERVESAVKRVLDYEDYSAFSDFKIKPYYDYENHFTVTFKLIDYEFDVVIRENEDGTLEYDAYDLDNWHEFRWWDHSGMDLLRFFLFQVCGDRRLRDKN